MTLMFFVIFAFYLMLMVLLSTRTSVKPLLLVETFHVSSNPGEQSWLKNI